MFFLLYKRAEDAVFDDFPKISDHFPKIYQDLRKLFRRPDERLRTFSEQILVYLKGQDRNVVQHDILTVLFFLNWAVCLSL